MIWNERWAYEKIDKHSDDDPFLKAAYALCGESYFEHSIGWSRQYWIYRRLASEAARAELAQDIEDTIERNFYYKLWKINEWQR